MEIQMDIHLVSIFKTCEMGIHKNSLCVDKTSPLIFFSWFPTGFSWFPCA